jgi:hypothetical protein
VHISDTPLSFCSPSFSFYLSWDSRFNFCSKGSLLRCSHLKGLLLYSLTRMDLKLHLRCGFDCRGYNLRSSSVGTFDKASRHNTFSVMAHNTCPRGRGGSSPDRSYNDFVPFSSLFSEPVDFRGLDSRCPCSSTRTRLTRTRLTSTLQILFFLS